MGDLRDGGRPRDLPARRELGDLPPRREPAARRELGDLPPRRAPVARRELGDLPAPTRDRPAARAASAARSRPDPRPMRIVFGMAGIAAASALTTALVAPPSGSAAGQTTIVLPPDPTPIVQHVTKYVQLKPGQTAPPQAAVQQAPAPKPRVVVVTTRQSGKP